MCERWVGDWTNCNILTPSSFVFWNTSFSFCWAAQSGSWGPHSPLLGAGSLYSILSPTNWLQLTEPVCSPGLYNYLTPICFSWGGHICTQFNPSTVKVIPWYVRPDAPVPRLVAGSEVNMLENTKNSLAPKEKSLSKCLDKIKNKLEIREREHCWNILWN